MLFLIYFVFLQPITKNSYTALLDDSNNKLREQKNKR